MTTLPLSDTCWPVDHSCCLDWDTYPQDVQDRADALATLTLRALTRHRVGGCPVTLRPCRRSCADTGSTWQGRGPFATSAPWTPMISNGLWYNITCSCGDDPCGCTSLCEVKVPTPYVLSVSVDGQDLPYEAWRVDSPRLLVRLDGKCFPLCQDLALPLTEEGTWSITYSPGIPVDGLASYAAGVLACEFVKACLGQQCRLPSGVTSLSRGGVNMTIATEMFPNDRTGIREVDAWLSAILTPLRTSTVLSPDVSHRYGRVTIPRSLIL